MTRLLWLRFLLSADTLPFILTSSPQHTHSVHGKLEKRSYYCIEKVASLLTPIGEVKTFRRDFRTVS